MVGAHDRNDRIRKLHALKDFRPNERVNLHALEFFGRQPPGLGDDVLRDGQLADVVKNRSRTKRFELGRRQAHFLSNGHGIDLHAPQVLMRAVILGLDCERQCFNRPQMESSHALGVIAFGLQPGQIKAVRTEDQIHNRKNQQRRLPASFFVN